SIEYLDKLKSTGKPYEYKLFPNLGHNTAFSDDQEPIKDAINWIKKQVNKKIISKKTRDIIAISH
ncbi:MAG: hypothetical protein RSH24_12145, partial [Flavobacterium sp.]